MKYLSKIKKSKLRGTAILRLDFNTEDEWRMEATIPTIKFLLRQCEKIVILSHRGRPQKSEKELSLRKDAINLQKLLKRKVIFIPHFRFAEIKNNISRSPKGSVFLMENLRFIKGEEKNDKKLGKILASLGDFYINDAFAVSHRDDASVVSITKFLPSFAGLELENELKHLSIVLKKPKKPIVIILGGGKAHDKLGVIKHFKNKAKYFLLGGAAANTILYLKGIDVKNSLIDKDKKDLAKLKNVLHYKNLILPIDWLSEQNKILDNGEKTNKLYASKIRQAKTIIWSGPMGVIEKKSFEKGTLAIAKAIIANKKAFSIAGGGETVMFLKKHQLDKKISFISTGGGAMMEFLAGEKLPGIEALKK
jgi:3-phosphoglycerate kinase